MPGTGQPSPVAEPTAVERLHLWIFSGQRRGSVQHSELSEPKQPARLQLPAAQPAWPFAKH